MPVKDAEKIYCLNCRAILMDGIESVLGIHGKNKHHFVVFNGIIAATCGHCGHVRLFQYLTEPVQCK